MIITPKIDYLEGCFDTKKVRMHCVPSKNRGRPEHPIGKYYEYWEKSQFCPFEDEVILKNKSK